MSFHADTSFERLAFTVAIGIALSCSDGSSAPGPSPEPGPGPAAILTIVAGDEQVIQVDDLPPVAPQVRVTDAEGKPVPNATVTFTPGEYHGSVETPNAITGPDGVASSGRWFARNAAAHSMAVLTASSPGCPSVRFHVAVGAKPSGTVTVEPVLDALVSSTFPLRASVHSTSPIAKVTALVVGVDASGTENPWANNRLGQQDGGEGARSEWSGWVVPYDISSGVAAVFVTANDTSGSVGEAVRFTHIGTPITVTVHQPELRTSYTATNATLEVAASCTTEAPAGCSSLELQIEGEVVLSGTESIEGSLDLTRYLEGVPGPVPIGLQFIGTDASGLQTMIWRNTYVVADPGAQLVNALDGTVLDVLGTRILYEEDYDIALLDTSTGSKHILGPGEGTILLAELTPSGAVYARHIELPPPTWSIEELCVWEGGTLTRVWDSVLDDTLRTAGEFLAFTSNSRLTRRHLVTGAEVVIALIESFVLDSSWDLAENGDVVYTGNDFNLYRWSAGVVQQLTTDSAEELYPVIGDDFVVYTKRDGSTYQLALQDETGETILASGNPRDRLVAGSYAAYVLLDDLTKTQHVWRHSRAGEELLGTLPTDLIVTLEGMAPDGTLVVRAIPPKTDPGEDNSLLQRRYLAAPGARLEELGLGAGKAVFRDDAFYVLVEGAVYRILQ